MEFRAYGDHIEAIRQALYPYQIVGTLLEKVFMQTKELFNYPPYSIAHYGIPRFFTYSHCHPLGTAPVV